MTKRANTDTPIHHLLAGRWSPRAFDPSATVSDAQLSALLEAARWAPSFGNTQPARYLVGRRGDATFDKILGVLTERNQSWAHRASVLMIGVAVTRNEKGDIPYATYSVALASQNLVLQAVDEGLGAHQMAGFDADAARAAFALPDDAVAVIAIAVGVVTDAAVLGEEKKIARERAERTRIPLSELALRDWDRPLF